VALLVGGDAVERLRRGLVLIAPEGGLGAFGTVATRRLLVALSPPSASARDHDQDAWPMVRDLEARLHIGTDQADALVIGRGRHVTQLDDSGARTTLVKLDRDVAVRAGDRFVLRRPPPSGLLAGGIVIDPMPASSRARRRETPERLARLTAAAASGDGMAAASARLDLHGLVRTPGQSGASSMQVADDARDAVTRAVEEAVASHHAAEPRAAGMALTDIRALAASTLRPLAGGTAADAADGADAILATLIAAGRLRRDGDVVAVAGYRTAAPDPARAAAMERLVAVLDVTAPPSLREAAAAAGSSTEAIRELEREGRIVVVDDDLAWARPAWERLRDQAVGLARSGPLTPAALRDASGTSRKYVMALLEDFQRRGILTRTVAGHVPGPRA
jgi:selenocysteine-specific elongation factor